MLKKYLLIIGIIFFIIITPVSIYFLRQNQENRSEAASEEVHQAEKKDLSEFGQVWQDFQDKQQDFAQAKLLAVGAGGRFYNVPVANVDQETLYGNDLNYILIVYFFDEYRQPRPISESTLNKALDILIQDSLLLQRAEEEGLFQLDSSFFNVQNKDHSLRNQKINQARTRLSDRLVQKVSGEAITIWFKNAEIPISVEVGREVAQQQINVLYDQLKKGEITFVQAGEIIKNNGELGEKVDPAYKNNAYFNFNKVEKEQRLFIDPAIDKELWSLGEGQMTTVLTGKVPNNNGQWEEAFFMIVKLNKRTGELGSGEDNDSYNSTDELLKDTKDAQIEKMVTH